VGTRSTTQIAVLEFTNSTYYAVKTHAQHNLTTTKGHRGDNDKGALIQLTRASLHAWPLAKFKRTSRGGILLAQLSISG